MNKLTLKHPVFTNVDDMLSPKNLGKLSGKRINKVECQVLQGHSGLAGAELSRVFTDCGTFFMKRMSPDMDWIMFATQDRLCRSVTLWQYGLLDELMPHQEHKTLACAETPEGWYILMEDLNGHLFSWESTFTASQVQDFLDCLARMHARFWGDPRLDAEQLGLCKPEQLIEATILPMKHDYSQLKLGVLPEWIRGGWAAMPALLDADVYQTLLSLAEEPAPLYEALGRFPATLLHGDFRAENLAFTDRPIVFDWQQATKSLMTVDLAWFVKHDNIRRALSEADAVLHYRQRLEYWLGKRFNDATWQEMLDLGYLVDVLRSTCFLAFFHALHLRENKLVDAQREEVEAERRNMLVRRAAAWLAKQTVR